MLQLNRAVADEGILVAAGREASRVPVADGILNTEFALEGAQGGGSVQGPVAPGAAGEAILRSSFKQLLRKLYA